MQVYTIDTASTANIKTTNTDRYGFDSQYKLINYINVPLMLNSSTIIYGITLNVDDNDVFFTVLSLAIFVSKSVTQDCFEINDS